MTSPNISEKAGKTLDIPEKSGSFQSVSQSVSQSVARAAPACYDIRAGPSAVIQRRPFSAMEIARRFLFPECETFSFAVRRSLTGCVRRSGQTPECKN